MFQKLVLYFTLCVFVLSPPTKSASFFKDVNADFRIVGGKPAKPGEFLGQVSLQNRFYSHICAGTLIDPIHIVTAAHCHQREKPILYVMGDDLWISINGSASRQRRKISHFVPHPDFSGETMANDIAIIRVDEPFEETKTFRPMKRTPLTPPPGAKCTVVGWGYTTDDIDEGEISYKLLKTNVDVVEMDFCNSSFSYDGAMQPGMICAGLTRGGGHDACQGDSGGLLTCGGLGFLSGVVSFGFKCGLPSFPGIYSDIYFYSDWIDQIVSSKNLPQYEFSPFTALGHKHNSAIATIMLPTMLSLLVMVHFPN